jgi:Mn2+/Fe2+ NRAMP family transporter
MIKRLASILLWSVIAAAFVGPGTVATAASSGTQFGLSLMWALAFSTVACLVLQEASARLSVVSRKSLGAALRSQYPAGTKRLVMNTLVLGAVVIGCAAYQAGNILGGVAGAALATDISPKMLTLLIGSIAGFLLWFQSPPVVARLLSLIVALMGIAFLVTAWRIGPPLGEVVQGTFLPSLPAGSSVLVLGLLGTTVVPYNLFLGSAIAPGEDLADLRLSLAVAIGFGGIISLAILIAGTAVPGTFSFEALSGVLERGLGSWTNRLFALGLFGAGFSSAVTAPLAAALTASQILGTDRSDVRWSQRSWRYRAVWLGVLVAGVGFGVSDVRPIPAIVLAQALNGLLLPLVSIFLFRAVNDVGLMGRHTNRLGANTIMAVVVAVSFLLGISTLGRAISAAMGLDPPPISMVAAATALLIVVVGRSVYRDIRKSRSSEPSEAE